MPKTIFTIFLKVISLVFGQGVALMADFFLVDGDAVRYYTFLNSTVFFAVLSGGTFTQKYSQLYQADRNTSLSSWMSVLLSWNILVLVFLILISLLWKNLNILYLGLCGFSLGISAIYSENRRILNKINSTILFPELTRSLLIFISFLIVVHFRLDIESSLTLVYVFLVGMIFYNLPKVKFTFKLEFPDWKIFVTGLISYMLMFDLWGIKNFYISEDVVIFARYQKFALLQILIIEMWYLSESYLYHSMKTVNISKYNLYVLTLLSIIFSCILTIMDVVIFEEDIYNSLLYLISGVLVSLVYVFRPGKLRFQLFEFTPKYIVLLSCSVGIYFCLMFLNFSITTLYFFWVLLICIYNIIAYKISEV